MLSLEFLPQLPINPVFQRLQLAQIDILGVGFEVDDCALLFLFDWGLVHGVGQLLQQG